MPEPKEWMKDLPEDIRNNPALQSFEDVGALAKSYAETKALVGRKGLILPPEGSDDKAWEPVYETLGRPKESKDYELPTLPNGVQLKPEVIEDFRTLAHQLGMNKKQFKQAFGHEINKLVKNAEAKNKADLEARQASETALRAAFGAKYEEKIQGVQKLMDTYGGENATEIVKKFGSDPDMIALLGRIVEDMSEASLEKLGHVKGSDLTPEEARDEIQKIRSDKDHPLNNAFNNPNAGSKHIEAKRRVDQLYGWAYPGKKKM